MENFNQIYWKKILFFINTRNQQKEFDDLELVQGVNFQLTVSLENNGTKYFSIFEISCDKICITKAFVAIATAERHLGLSSIYSKHNLFNRSKPERDELQNRHLVLFKSLCYEMQISTLSWVWDQN